MKFRLISDLHVDVNEKNPFTLLSDDDFVTLVAGDDTKCLSGFF